MRRGSSFILLDNHTMARSSRRATSSAEAIDPSGWILDNGLAEFMVFHTKEIQYMCMLGYTFLHGSKVFSTVSPTAPFSYKFVSMVMACTGGGILVPIFINSIPVPLSTDAYPIAIGISFLLHYFFPVLREVLNLSPIFKGMIVFLYEVTRAYVVTKLTKAAGNAIAPSEFSFPLFGPIFCGAIAGCGGAFLPLNKGLDPIKEGLAPNMITALIAAAGFHLYLNTSISDGVKDAPKKAQVFVALFFVVHGWIYNFKIDVKAIVKQMISGEKVAVKKEPVKKEAETKKKK